MAPRRLAVALVLLTLCGVVAGAGEGDRKIRETIEEAEEAERRAKKERPKPPRETDDEEEEPGLFGIIARAFFEVLFQAMFENAVTLRFAAYPYSQSSGFVYNTSTFILPEERKWVSVELSADAANHLDGTWGNSNRLVAQLAGLHLNVYNLSVFAETEGFSVLSANAGITLYVPDFMLSGFVGGYTLDVLERAYFSFGFCGQLFLPGRVHLEVFNVNAAIGDQIWSHWQGTAGVSLGRLSLGAGWHHNIVAGTLYSGPCLRAALWL